MRFSVFQLQFSKQSPAHVIATKQNLMFEGSDAFNTNMSDLFACVMDVDATDLDDVFEIGNIGPQSKIVEKFAVRRHSVSVGDIIRDNTDGTYHMVDDMGFTQVEFSEASC